MGISEEVTVDVFLFFSLYKSMVSNETVLVKNAVSKLYFLQFISIGIGAFLYEHFRLV